MAIGFTSDGTQLALAGGNGAVSFAQLVDRSYEWKNITCTLTEDNRVRVHVRQAEPQAAATVRLLGRLPCE
jgi:hypothetical protein